MKNVETRQGMDSKVIVLYLGMIAVMTLAWTMQLYFMMF